MRTSLLLLALCGLSAVSTSFAITSVRIATGLTEPLYVTAAPGDTSRLYVVERVGRIKVLQNGQVTGTFLDIHEAVETGFNEQGLLGLAFHPQFATNHFFYINYTRESDGATIISRWTGSYDQANAASETVLITQAQPYVNHNGGMVTFGPDGYFYFGLGDGGSGGDPQNRAQSDTTILGKLLRIDVNSGTPYGIPPDNPFAAPGDGARDEIWAKGLRNPWRFSFDRATGDLYIADVGQGQWEEIHITATSSNGGENYGWRLMEGNHCFNPPQNCDPGGLEHPVHEYNHDSGCSITGGYVYRGCAIPELQGHYFFADFCSNRIWSFRYRSGGITDLRDRTEELLPDNGGSIAHISSFGEDNFGELYITDLTDGEMFKIMPDTLEDANGNGIPDGCESAATGGRRTGSVDRFRLHQNNPNPFNPITQISFELATTSTVKLTVHDITGRHMVTLVDDQVLAAGPYTINFRALNLPSGVYIYRLTAGSLSAQNKMVLLR